MEQRVSTLVDRLTTRARVVALVVVASAPALALTIAHGIEERVHAEARARDELLRFVRLAAARQEELLAGARGLLHALASGAARDIAHDELQCREYLRRVAAAARGLYHTLGIRSAEGALLCEALERRGPTELSEPRELRLALETGEFAVGNYQDARATGKPSVALAYPFLDSRGQLAGAVFAALDLEQLEQQLFELPLPESARLTVFDSAGTILARRPPDAGRIGESARNPQVQAAIAEGKAAAFEAPDSDGVERLFGYAPAGRNADGFPAFHIVVSVPRAVILAPAERTLLRNALSVLAAVVIVLLAAWYGAEALFARRIRALLEVARRVQAGDYSARCGARAGREELSQLGAALDEMAGALEEREQRLRQALAELREEALSDPLTRLYNRRYLWDFLRRELLRGQRSGASVAVILLDLDRFKEINDRYGHAAGDLVLVRAAQIVVRSIRGSDIACRYGGEELLVVLPEATREAALARAEAMRRGVAALALEHEGRSIGPLSASFGVALYPEHAANAEDLIEAADRALYRAKRAGRNRVVVFSPEPPRAPAPEAGAQPNP